MSDLKVADLLNPSSSRASPSGPGNKTAASAAVNMEIGSHESSPAVVDSNDTLPAANTYDLPFPSNAYEGAEPHLNNDPVPKTETEDTDATELKPLPHSYGLDGSDDRHANPSLDADTLKAIKEAQNEYSTRRPLKTDRTDKSRSPTPELAKQVIPKKRPAASKAAAKKKGEPSSIKKPPPKKRKLDADERSVATNRKASQSATPAGSSPQALRSSPAASDGGASDVTDDDTVYCICRRPDDHTWMIGCDGDCEEWFHGKCIKIKQEDGDLIDKFFCPACIEKGQGVTTWKPMCRRSGCRKPARLKKGAASKYCSDQCGVRFFKELADKHANISAQGVARPDTKKRKHDAAENGNVGIADDSNIDLGPLGGAISSAELKSLAHSVEDVDSFRRLGDSGILTPPPTASPEAERKGSLNENSISNAMMPEEQTRVSAITERKTVLRARRKLLKAREKFLVWSKENLARLVAETKVKNLCGFDRRLAWADGEFAEWLESDEGKEAVKANSLEHTATAPAGEDTKEFVCDKPRCQKHKDWPRMWLQEVRFEEADVGDEMRKIDREEQDIKARAAMRARIAAAGGSLIRGDMVDSVEDVTRMDVPTIHEPDEMDVSTLPIVDGGPDVVMTDVTV